MLGQSLNGDEVLVIGDTPLDVRCARAINARMLAVATGGATMDELVSHRPDWAVKNLKAVTAKEAVYGFTD